MRKRIVRPIPTPGPQRGGTTLTEVLMALLCMGIGVVAVASLFPIALLRSVQATQLTSATILRFNAETLIDLHNQLPTATAGGNRNLVLNPDFDANFTEHFGRNYLIDPLGAMVRRPEKGLAADQGNGTQQDQVGRITRFDGMRIFNAGTAFTEAAAEAMVTLPDSWITVGDEFPSAIDPAVSTGTCNWVELPNTDLVTEAENMIAGGSTVRIILFNKNNRMSEARTLGSASINTTNNPNRIQWGTSLPNSNQYFPSTSPGAEPGSISRVRLEVKERRYTWLLSVRNDTPRTATDVAAARARVDIVVFFRRSPSAEDETPYVLSGSGRTYTVSKIASGDWSDFYSSPYPNPYPDPFVKKGGFMLDTNTGVWHRVQKINESTQTVTLERNTSSLHGHHVVFMKGVVDVYQLGVKP